MQILETWKESEKSCVYLGFQEETRRMVVVKHLKNGGAVYEKLQHLPHPYLPKIYSLERQGDTLIVVEEYIPSRPFNQISVGEKELSRLFRELCQVLRFLHSHGVIHRDINPSNLLLGDDGHIRLIDFDAARAPQSTAQQDTVLLGTPGFASPEQYGFSQTDQRADIYGLGATFEELLGNHAKKRKWKNLLRKCRELDPKRRFSSIFSIQCSLLFRKLRHWSLYPVAVLFFLYYVGGLSLMYFFVEEANPYVQVILDDAFASQRDQIFAEIDMDTMPTKPNDNCQISDQQVNNLAVQWSDSLLLYTGYETADGASLYGRFFYDPVDGFQMFAFQGLVCMEGDTAVEAIYPENCDPYGAAVWALYHMAIFN